MTSPIWKDTTYTSSTSALTYTINVDGSSIFSGTSVAPPDGGPIEIRLNDICENWLHTEMPDFRSFTDNTTQHPLAFRSFVIKDSNSNTTLGTYAFLNCYDQTFDWTGQTATLSNPVNGHASSQMYLFKTDFAGGSVTTRTSLGSIDGYDRSYCGEGAIYYLNRRGGYDSFLLEGYIKRTDNYERDSLLKVYNNTTIDFGERPYATKTTASWELNTGWLTDEQSKNFAWNVAGSNQIWLHDFQSGEIYPVEIEDTNVEYKEYRHGRKKVSYSVVVRSAQSYFNKL